MRKLTITLLNIEMIESGIKSPKLRIKSQDSGIM
jgi:hypothetical protein